MTTQTFPCIETSCRLEALVMKDRGAAASSEKAGRQTAMYSAPAGSGVL